MIAANKAKWIILCMIKIVVYGWYDNEMAGYTHMLTERTVSIASTLH